MKVDEFENEYKLCDKSYFRPEIGARFMVVDEDGNYIGYHKVGPFGVRSVREEE